MQTRSKLQQHFETTATKGKALLCLSALVIISPDSISLEQASCTLHHVNERFNDKDVEAPSVSGPLPVDPKLELELFHSLPLTAEQKEELAKQCSGLLAHRACAFMRAAAFTPADIA